MKKQIVYKLQTVIYQNLINRFCHYGPFQTKSASHGEDKLNAVVIVRPVGVRQIRWATVIVRVARFLWGATSMSEQHMESWWGTQGTCAVRVLHWHSFGAKLLLLRAHSMSYASVWLVNTLRYGQYWIHVISHGASCACAWVPQSFQLVAFDQRCTSISCLWYLQRHRLQILL